MPLWYDCAKGWTWVELRPVLATNFTSDDVSEELCVNLRRRVAHPLPSANIAKLIEDYLSWEIVINTPQSIAAVLGIEAR